jgi:putative protease
MNLNTLPELLLFVGNMEMLLAAIHNGADAVYIGMPKFNARGRTQDFSIEELREMIELAHLYDVKVHLAFNILIFQDELEEARSLLLEILPLGPDAMIVQDLGLARLIRSMAPDQIIHASTQMTITNYEAMKFLDDLKLDRFVLGREVSLDEMKIIRTQTNKELEVFVHGALCVSYSGQCLTSESIGGRSANRGQCAQSCRLDYEMFVDGEKKNLIDEKYLVSPQDLCGIEEIPKLMNLGINSFKVEGRLKSKEYVASAASSYKKVIEGQSSFGLKEEMAITYSRGFFSGWLNGVNHQELVPGTYSAHQGLNLGKIKKIDHKKKNFIIESNIELSLGDGLLLTETKKNFSQGSPIYSVTAIGNKNYEVSLNHDFPFSALTLNHEVFLNSSPKLFKKINGPVLDKNKNKKIPVSFHVHGKLDETLKISVSDGRNTVSAESSSKLSAAQNKPLSKDMIKDELGSLGGTCFTLGSIHFDFEESFFLNHKELKQIRRDLMTSLIKLRITPEQVNIKPSLDWHKHQSNGSSQLSLNVLIRNKHQIESLKGSLVNSVILDFDYGKDYQGSVTKLKSMGLKVGIATTRILKPTEYKNLNVILKANPDFILVRNLGAMEYFLANAPEKPLHGDYSLNITNSLTAEYLLAKGLKSFTPSYDLNQWQLFDLLEWSPSSRSEITIHQYLPEFHMEHCVFAGFLSEGKSFRDCGMPCEKHDVVLKDAYGNFHPLKADQECRNTMFRGTPQSAGMLVPELLKLKATTFRLEALSESPEELRHKIDHYLDLIHQKITPQELMEKIKVSEKYGLSQGQMDHNKAYKDRKKQYPSV